MARPLAPPRRLNPGPKLIRTRGIEVGGRASRAVALDEVRAEFVLVRREHGHAEVEPVVVHLLPRDAGQIPFGLRMPASVGPKSNPC